MIRGFHACFLIFRFLSLPERHLYQPPSTNQSMTVILSTAARPMVIHSTPNGHRRYHSTPNGHLSNLVSPFFCRLGMVGK